MKPCVICFAPNAFIPLLLTFVRPAFSQIVGCDGPDVECPTKQTATDGGVCGHNEDGIGIVSFDSNITADGPLTWTVRTSETAATNDYPRNSGRLFYLGTPPSLNLRDVTNFGACTAILWNVTSALQLPSEFNDLGNFGCNTVMGAQCAQDVVAQTRNELLRLLGDSSYDARQGSPCDVVAGRISKLSPPESCGGLFNADRYGFGTPWSKRHGTPRSALSSADADFL